MDTQVIKYNDFFVLLNAKGKWSLFETPYEEKNKEAYVKHLSGISDLSETAITKEGIGVIVFITEICNLRCSYCKVMKMITSPNKKSTDTTAIVDSLLKCLSLTTGYINVTFYGGEPLLKFTEIDKICETLSEKHSRFKYSLTTNGTRFSDEIAHVLNKHKFVVGVSMDSSEPIHDLNRNYINSSNSHQTVSANYRKMKESGIECGPIAVVTDPSKMPEMFDYFIKNFNEHFIYLKPLDVVGTEGIDELDSYFSELLKSQLSLLKKNVAAYASGKPRRVETYTLVKLKNIFLSDRPEVKTCKNSLESNCTIDINIKGVEPNGNMLPCPTFKKRPNWDQQTLQNIKTKGDYCKGCNYSSVCTSFCLGEMDDTYIDQFLNTGDTRPLDVICKYNKGFIDEVFQLVREDWPSLNKYIFQ